MTPPVLCPQGSAQVTLTRKLAWTPGMGQTAPGASPGPALTTGAVTMWEPVCPSACNGRPVKTQDESVVLGTEAQGSGQTNELGLAWGIVRGSRSAGASQEGRWVGAGAW